MTRLAALCRGQGQDLKAVDAFLKPGVVPLEPFLTHLAHASHASGLSLQTPISTLTAAKMS